ncbi:MAG: sporulation protein [Saprospiraceae bacterium]|nr:sporulation protein [Saprospiraceae bacterium]
MFGQIKKVLGIEGVKINVEVIQPVISSEKFLRGFIKLTTLRESRVEKISLKLVEKYYRGRREDKLINEYKVGEITLENGVDLKKDEIVEIPFELPFKIYQSQMDVMQEGNFFISGLVKLAKKIKGVKSEYHLEAEAFVKDTKLNPHCKQQILMNT